MGTLTLVFELGNPVLDEVDIAFMTDFGIFILISGKGLLL